MFFIILRFIFTFWFVRLFYNLFTSSISAFAPCNDSSIFLIYFVDFSVILPIFCTFSNVKSCSCSNRVRSFVDLHVCMTWSLVSSFSLFPYPQYVVSLRYRVIDWFNDSFVSCFASRNTLHSYSIFSFRIKCSFNFVIAGSYVFPVSCNVSNISYVSIPTKCNSVFLFCASFVIPDASI